MRCRPAPSPRASGERVGVRGRRARIRWCPSRQANYRLHHCSRSGSHDSHAPPTRSYASHRSSPGSRVDRRRARRSTCATGRPNRRCGGRSQAGGEIWQPQIRARAAPATNAVRRPSDSAAIRGQVRWFSGPGDRALPPYPSPCPLPLTGARVSVHTGCIIERREYPKNHPGKITAGPWPGAWRRGRRSRPYAWRARPWPRRAWCAGARGPEQAHRPARCR